MSRQDGSSPLRVVRLIAVAALAVFGVPVALAAAPVVITFEDLPASGPGTGLRTVLTNQYRNLGVVFQGAALLDFSQGIAIPGFAHSGTRAVQHCYAVEFCNAPFAIGFTSPQSRVKVWVGYTNRLPEGARVMLTAFDPQNNVVARVAAPLGPSQGPLPIRTPLELRVSQSAISRVELSVEGHQVSITALAADDLEFDRIEKITHPDLAIQSFTHRIDRRGRVEVIAVLSNIGQSPSPSTLIRAESPGWGSASTEVRELPPGQSARVAIPIGRKLGPGSYPLRLLVDPDNSTGDVNRGNNTASGEIVIPAIKHTTKRVSPVPKPAPPIHEFSWLLGILSLGAVLLLVVLSVFRSKSLSPRTVQPIFRPVWDAGRQRLETSSADGSGIELRLRTHPGTKSSQIQELNRATNEGNQA